MMVLENKVFYSFTDQNLKILSIKEESPQYINHDKLFKQLIRYFFDDFLEVFFPEIYKQIDLASISFVSGEVFTDVVKGSSRRLDMVVETKLRDTEAIILLHVESQSSVQYDFNERMFQY